MPLREQEVERVFAFRMFRFLEMGFTEAQADVMAGNPEVDWHRTKEILESCVTYGCPDPHKVTYRIVS